MLTDRAPSMWDRITLHRATLRRAGISDHDADDYIVDWLPRHYPSGPGYPILDYRYIREVTYAVRGGVFLDSGSLHNAHLYRQRLKNTPYTRRKHE